MKAEPRRWCRVRSLGTAILLSFAWLSSAAAAIESFALPDALPPNDDGSSAAVPIGFPINFFGVTHTQLFVNNNGNVTFGAPLSTFTPFGLVGTRTPIIAPFFADVDTRGPGSGVVRFGTPPGRPDLFVVNWVQVGYFREHDDKLNSFQLILQDLSAVPDFIAGDFRIIFNYDRIQWETGDASGGTNGLGGSSARVGFSNGSGQPGTFFELNGSGRSGSLLDGGALSLVGDRIPTADPSLPLGRYQFVVRNGGIAQADLAIAADIADDEDDAAFDLVVRNFGPSAAAEVQVLFTAAGGRVRSVRPTRFCTLPTGSRRSAQCAFPILDNQNSRRIKVFTTEAIRATAAVGSNTFDSDVSNNIARASSSCKGQVLSRSAPDSVVYDTAAGAATQTLRLAIINTGDDQSIEIRRIRPLADQPFQVGRVRPGLPETIGPGKSKVFRVDTFVSAGSPVATAQRPYFRLQIRCPD